MSRLLRGLSAAAAATALVLGFTVLPAQAAYSKACHTHSSDTWGVPVAYGPPTSSPVKAYQIYDDYLSRGQYCQTGKARLIFQDDGNLVVYDETGKARWAASWSKPGVIGNAVKLVMQDDANLVLYNSANTSVWSSKSWLATPNNANFLAVQEDGNVVIYNSTEVRWSTKTNH